MITLPKNDMETFDMKIVLGIKGQNFVMLAADTMVAKKTIFLNNDQTKIRKLSQDCLMCLIGNNGNCRQFGDSIEKHYRLYGMQHEYPMTTNMFAHFTRHQLSKNLRSKFNCKIAVLLAGYDPKIGATLHHIDEMGSLLKLNYTCLGLGHQTCKSILTTFWKPDIHSEQAYGILKKCFAGIQNRFVVNLCNFEVFIIDKDGARQFESLVQ